MGLEKDSYEKRLSKLIERAYVDVCCKQTIHFMRRHYKLIAAYERLYQ